MSDIREKARAALASVPAGPWKVDQGTRGYGVRAVDSKVAIAVCGRADAHQTVAAYIAATPDLIVALCDEGDEASKEITRLRTVQDKFVTDLAKCDGIIAGQDERYRLEITRASGTIRHLQAHNDHLVELNSALKSQVAEAALCRELIAERDALQAKLSDIEEETRRRAESADPNDETWYTRTEYFLRINAEAENVRLKAELAAATTERDDALALSRRMADVVGAAEFREASAAAREKRAWAEVERLRAEVAKFKEENGGCSICAAVSGEAQANRVSFGRQLTLANDAQEQIARKLAEAQAAQRGAIAALVKSEAEVVALKAMCDSIDQVKSASDLLAKVMRGDYAWPSGVAWAIREAHRRLTGGAPDGLYTHAQAANGSDATTTEGK